MQCKASVKTLTQRRALLARDLVAEWTSSRLDPLWQALEEITWHSAQRISCQLGTLGMGTPKHKHRAVLAGRLSADD